MSNITKLPPGYPEGSAEGMARWSTGHKTPRFHGEGNLRKWSLDKDNYPGSDLHIKLLDLGLSAAEFDNWDASILPTQENVDG